MQGLKEQKFPPGLRQAAAEATAFQGPGRSRNNASAWPARAAGKPSSSAGAVQAVQAVQAEQAVQAVQVVWKGKFEWAGFAGEAQRCGHYGLL